MLALEMLLCRKSFRENVSIVIKLQNKQVKPEFQFEILLFTKSPIVNCFRLI